jgi:hypothetical protein
MFAHFVRTRDTHDDYKQSMKQLFSAVDSLLRGKRTSDIALRQSEQFLSVRTFGPAAIVLGAIFGLCMASYAIANRPSSESAQQAFAAMVKLPALFLVTLVISFPSLYVFNVLIGCRLGLRASLRLMVSAIVVNLAVAASLGPIVAFFAVSTQSYPFMVLLNVLMLALGGAIGLAFLSKSLRKLAEQAADEEYRALFETYEAPASNPPPQEMLDGPAPDSGASATGSHAPGFFGRSLLPTRDAFIRNRTSNASLIFWIWVMLYASVGAQTGWLLRPFIGHPNLAFAWFRPRSGNFFLGVFESLSRLLS